MRKSSGKKSEPALSIAVEPVSDVSAPELLQLPGLPLRDTSRFQMRF
jgi:hypothetical protein